MYNVQNKLVKMCFMGLMCAISIVLVYLIRVPLMPSAQFLEYDPADIPILLTAYYLGPLPGVAVTLIVSVLQGITVSAQSGPAGILMHFFATGTMALVVGMISRPGVFGTRTVIAAFCGALAMIGMMIPLNLIMIPAFNGTPRDVVVGMLPTVIIPFNAIKAGINSVPALLIYAATFRFVGDKTDSGRKKA